MHFIDLQAQYAALKSGIDSRIRRVLEHGKFIDGPEVTELESHLQEYVGVKHAIACANGTDAIVLSLMAMGIRPGDAVFCPTFTFFATAEAIAACGAIPVFVDSERESFNICPLSLEAAIKEIQVQGKHEPRAVITVDLFGLPARYPQIRKIADTHGLKILEDAAQGFGGAIKGARAGSFGDIAATSFFPSKPLGCYGDGGAVFTDDDELAGLVRSLSHHGKGANKYDNVRIGMNSRLDTIQAAILLEKLVVLAEEITLRDAVADQYHALLKDSVDVPVIPDGYSSAWAQYTIRSPRRDQIKNTLARAGIPTMVYYSMCMHQQVVFAQGKALCEVPVDLGRAELLAGEVLSLPMHARLEAGQIKLIGEAVNSALD